LRRKPQKWQNLFKITYNVKMAQGAGWSGIYWQHPANNWGDKKGGYSLVGAKSLHSGLAARKAERRSRNLKWAV